MTSEAPNLLDYLPTPFKPAEEETESDPQSESRNFSRSGPCGISSARVKTSLLRAADPLDPDSGTMVFSLYS